MVGHELHFHQVLRSFVAFGFPLFQLDEFLQRSRIALAPPSYNSLKAYLLRGFDSDQLEMLRGPKGVDFPRISDGVDHIVFVVFDLGENALRKNISAVFLAQFITDKDEQLTSRLMTSGAYLVANNVG